MDEHEIYYLCGAFRCGVLLECDDHFLLCCGNRTGKWGIPKGHLQRRDHDHYISFPVDADWILYQRALSELREETGVNLDVDKEVPEYFIVNETAIFHLRVDRMVPVEVKDRKEIEIARWVPLEEVKELAQNYDLSNQILRSLFREEESECAPVSAWSDTDWKHSGFARDWRDHVDF